ncbi:hypothetical protein GJAV_G00267630 [Gymnothorax javanicus]|nr:hypothetical protein GJAV_G00267630 [Gymnothorax javanicus]
MTTPHLKRLIFTLSVICFLVYSLRKQSDIERLQCDRLLAPAQKAGMPGRTFVGSPDLSVQIGKLDINKIPLWMLEDVYRREEQSRNKICQDSLRNSEDAEFYQAFIPDIQLFLHEGHANISEWNRLVHFNNPFGFRSYDYTELKEVVDLIPKPKKFPFLPVPSADKQDCVRCAVVANGGILSGSKMGEEIDSHDYVFRMDGAVIEGYEEDVGMRTSVYVHTAKTLMASLNMIPAMGRWDIPIDEGIRYVLIPVGMTDFEFLGALLWEKSILWKNYENMWQRFVFLDEFDKNKYHVLHPDFLRYVRNRFLKTWHLNEKSWNMFRPTSGAFSLFLAIQTCDTVNAYGFLTTNHRKFADTYFEKYSDEMDVLFYDYSLELELLNRLHNSNIIKLYKRRTDFVMRAGPLFTPANPNCDE